MRDLPVVGDRVQIRPMVTREGKLLGGAIGTVRCVVDIDQIRGRREVGLLVQTGVSECYCLALSETTVIGGAP